MKGHACNWFVCSWNRSCMLKTLLQTIFERFFFFAFSSDMEMNDQSYAWKWILCFGNCSLGVRCRRTCKDWDILLGCNCKSKMVWEIVCILVACFPTLCRCCDASGWRNKTARPVIDLEGWAWDHQACACACARQRGTQCNILSFFLSSNTNIINCLLVWCWQKLKWKWTLLYWLEMMPRH